MRWRPLPAFAAIDFLSCLLVVFVAVALTSRPPQVKTYGAYAVVVTWPKGHNDVDLDARRCVELRSQLRISCDSDSPAFVAPNGEPLEAHELALWLRKARLVRTSLDVNGSICRSLLQIRSRRRAELEEVGA
jgi:hypothetical protein